MADPVANRERPGGSPVSTPARASAILALACGLAALLTPGCHEPVAAAATGPNVVLIVVDTLRADHLSSYGYGLPTDAPLRRFLDESTRFADCQAPASWTVPSTASLLTGLHPLRHGVVDHGTALSDEAFTIAEAMGDRGFVSAGFSHNHNVSAVTRFDQGFDRFTSFPGGSTAYPDISLMTEAAQDWLEHEVDGRFLLYLQPMNCHGPYLVPETHRDDLLGRAPATDFRYYGDPMRPILKGGEVERRADVGERLLTSLVEQYDTAVHYTLGELAAFLDELDDLGYYDSSLVIITADHGEELFEHGGFSHGYSLHDEVLHVPLFVKRPYQREAAVVDEPVCLQDILPTLVTELGLRTPYPLDGVSLSALLDDPSASLAPRDRVAHVSWHKRCVATSVQRGPLKLIEVERDYAGRRDVSELFDVVTDPGERHDLSRRPPIAPALDALRGAGATLGEGWRALALPPGGRVLESMDTATLEALGYL